MLLLKKGNKSIVLNLACLDHEGNSGCKNRSKQLYNILVEDGYVSSQLDTKSPSFLQTIWNGLMLIMTVGAYKPFGIMSIRSAGHTKFLYDQVIEGNKDANTYLIEGTGYGSLYAVKYLRKKGKKVLLAPANVESLAPYADAWTHKKSVEERFKDEISWYRSADMVFCISLEEQWILNIMGARAEFLSYVPPKELLVQIEKRRRNRHPDGSLGLLYVANFHNEPNRKGLEDLVERLERKKIVLNSKLIVVGMGCENIEYLADRCSEIEIHGFLSDQDLEDYYLRCNSVYLHHFPTSGMLTRVVEYLLSGIPLEGNLAALKSYYLIKDIENVYEMLLSNADREKKLLLNAL